MLSVPEVQQLLGSGGNVVGTDGDKIGSIGQVYLDDATGQPAWVTVKTGLFGGSESFVPLEQAAVAGDDIRVPYDKDRVKGAPRAEADGHLSPQEEAELYAYYGVSGYGGDAGTRTAGHTTGQTTGRTTERTTEREGVAGAVGHDTSGPTTDTAMTRSEESLVVGTQTRESGRARLRKYVVTEQQSVTVPVSHEEVRIEREPITDANAGAALDGPAISEEEHEVVLHEEVPVVATEARPVERVRVDTTTVTEQQQVSGEVRKERIDLDTDTGTGTDVRR